MIEKDYRKFLVKDFKLPIALFDDDSWWYYTNSENDKVYDNVTEKEQLLQQLVSSQQFKNAEEFYSYSAKLREKIIQHITSKAEYQQWNNQVLTQSEGTKFVEKKQLYQAANDGKIFMSIDIIKANFNSFRFFFPEIVDGCADYAEFIQQFDKHEYFLKSKQLRQVIFGNLNPSRQQYFQRKMIMMIHDEIQAQLATFIKNVSATSSDELVYELVCDEKSSLNVVEQFKQWQATSELGSFIKLECFKLHAKKFKCDSSKTEEFYLKEDVMTHEKEIKGVAGCFYPQVYKLIHNIPIYKQDLAFFYMECCCHFDSPIKLID